MSKAASFYDNNSLLW